MSHRTTAGELTQAPEDAGLVGSGEDGQNPQSSAFPTVQDAEAASIRLERFAAEGRDRFDLTRVRPIRKAEDVINQALALVGRDVVEIALSTPCEPDPLKDFACHAGNPSA